LATSATSGSAFRVEGKNVPKVRPGHTAELLYQAGNMCHVNVQFKLVPWSRALNLVKHGGADAAFRSSYKAERTLYGAYPMKNGMLDASRALSSYTYSLFIRKESDLSWNGVNIIGSDKKVAVERASAGISLAKSLGLNIVEFSDDDQMVQMLSAKRVDGVVGITNNIKNILARTPQLANQVVLQQPQLESKQGYVMFSKRTYNREPELVECFWDAIGKIRISPEYLELVKSYRDESKQ
jgi:polar amino acid transport system substrate-binding protein